MAIHTRYASASAIWQNWTPNSGAHLSAPDGALYVESSPDLNTVSGAITMEAGTPVPSGATINSVVVRARFRLASAGTRQVRAGFTGFYQAAVQNLTSTTFVDVDFPFATNPYTSTAWDVNGVNGLTSLYIRAYADGDGPVVHCDAVSLVVDYTTGTPPPEPLAGIVAINAGESTSISKVYAGSTIIWPAGYSEPPPDPGDELTLATFNAAMSKRVVFAHQSVGWQVIQGIQMWADDLGAADPTVIDVESTAMPGSGGFVGHFYAGNNGDPFSKLDELDIWLRTGGHASQIDVFVMKFCYADIRSTSGHTPATMFNAYKATMDALVTDFPSVTFIFSTTAIVMGENSDGGNNGLRQTYNNMVRNEYDGTGRLWDVADIESTDPNGNKVLYGGVESLYSGYASPDQRHIYGLGRTTVAAPLLSMIALL